MTGLRGVFGRAAETAREVGLLIKKDLTEHATKRRDAKKNGWGAATTVVLAVLLVTALVYFVFAFAKAYAAIPTNGVAAPVLRETELLTFVYALLFLIDFVTGVGKIYTSIANASDVRVLEVLPVKAQSVFLYKLSTVYLHEVVQNLLILLPISVTIGAVMKNGAGFFFGTAFAALFIPIAALLIASLVSIPLSRAFDFFRQRYVFLLIVFVAVIFGGFYLYSDVLNILEKLLATGDVRTMFDETTMNAIGAFTRYAYPVNLVAALTLGVNGWASFGVLLGISAVAGGGTYALAKLFVPKMLMRRLEGKRKIRKKRNEKLPRQRLPFVALLKKEATVVLRTPSYAFQYFAVAVLLPFMCYLSAGIVSRLLKSVVATESGYEVAVFVVAMFAMLTNTFSATNLSRDGKMAAYMKTFPIGGRTALAAKVVFCGFVSEFAIFASVLALAIGKFVTAPEAVGVFFFVSVLAFAEILFATRLDLNRPSIPPGEDTEITESGSVSAVSLIGLICSVLIGAVFVGLSLILNLRNLQAYRPLAMTLVSVALAAIFLASSLAYFFIGLKKRYREAL